MKYAMDFIKLQEREEKPRRRGLTLVRDPGMGVAQAEAFLESADIYVDYVKFRNLSPCLWPESLLIDKIAVYRRHDVRVFSGGIYAEMAKAQNVWDRALAYLNELGFEALEISSTQVPFTAAEKATMVGDCISRGLEVLYEWGSQKPTKPLDPKVATAEIRMLLDSGVSRVIIEEGEVDVLLGKEADSTNAGILADLIERVGIEHLIFEAVEQKQQVWLLKRYGATVNIGPNVAPERVPWLEAMRRGLGRPVDYFAFDPWLSAKSLPGSTEVAD